MGKLRDSLTNADKILRSIDKEVDKAADKFSDMVNNAFELTKIGGEGVDELYLYLTQKVKKEGKKWNEVAKEPVENYADGNVKRFIKGINDFEKQAINASTNWTFLSKSLDAEMKKAEKLLDDIDKQLGKKRKKLLQSAEFKNKISIYEKVLDKLQTALSELKKSLEKLVSDASNQPPSPNQIKKVLNISLKSTLADVDNLASRSIKQLLEKYTGAAKRSQVGIRKFRENGDFKAELKLINQMIKEADAMEQAATT